MQKSNTTHLLRFYPLFTNPTPSPQELFLIIEPILGKIIMESQKSKRGRMVMDLRAYSDHLWSGNCSWKSLEKMTPTWNSSASGFSRVSAREGDHKYDLPVGIWEPPLQVQTRNRKLSAC